MNRIDFMAQLERLLCDLPENERQDALCYYNDYFDDAGEEKESSIIQELGSPGKVAATIRASYRGTSENHGEYTENGYRDSQFSEKSQMPVQRSTGGDSRKQQEESHGRSYQGEKQSNQGHKRRGVGGWFLIILAVIILGPVVFGVGAGAIGTLAGVLAAIAALLISGFAVAIGGIAGIIKGAVIMAASPGSGLVAIGGGFILLAVGLLLILFFAWLLFKILPKAFRAIVNFLSRVFHHGRGRDEGGEAH
ncbi:DUF1700 domain-containing protein [Novisyntrophococcus fermenticellae]|uniref:DUF1700 domain-containing protein n=1 Tax=Novisyntrophococcus fermenticellae TaxID=2068655 RepID=UPI001E2D0046|nr:DUF1700 domain-containing protein [Novisyntrophococcus fermenticellae]